MRMTAQQLLSAQQNLRDLNEIERQKWADVQNAHGALDKAKAAHDSARWEAEEAFNDLREIEKQIMEGGANV